MAPAGSTRDALLTAAYAAVVSGGWDRTRMADVAAAAGVSRQTLYNEFGSKEALAQALTLREAERFLDGAEAVLDASAGGDPASAVAAAMAWVLRQAEDNPLLRAVLTDDPSGELLPLMTTRGEALHFAVVSRVAKHLAGDWPHLAAADADWLADAVVRLTVSHLVLPTQPVETAAAGLARLVTAVLSSPSLSAADGGSPR